MEFFLQSRPFLIHSGMNTIISQLTIVPHFCFQQMEDLYGVHDLSKSELNSTMLFFYTTAQPVQKKK